MRCVRRRPVDKAVRCSRTSGCASPGKYQCPRVSVGTDGVHRSSLAPVDESVGCFGTDGHRSPPLCRRDLEDHAVTFPEMPGAGLWMNVNPGAEANSETDAAASTLWMAELGRRVDIDDAARHAQRWRQRVPNLCTVVERTAYPGCARRAGSAHSDRRPPTRTARRDGSARGCPQPTSGVSSLRVWAAERLPPCRFRVVRRACAAGEAKITAAGKVAAEVLSGRARGRVATTLRCLVIPDLVMTHVCPWSVQLGARRVNYAANKP